MENRKVKNATALVYDGIAFKSKAEVSAYKLLCNAGIKPEYEPDKIVVQDGFRMKFPWFMNGSPIKTKVRDITYTPDFKFDYNGWTVYLEIKGFETDRFPVKRKMFLKYLETTKEKTVFAEVKSLSGLCKTLDQLKKL